MSVRTEKVGSVIKRVLAEPISNIAKEKYQTVLVTITAVRLSPDLRIANVYLSIFGPDISPGTLITYFEEHKGRLRHHIGSNVRLRFTPDLRFFLDDTLDQMEHIQNLLDKVKKDDSQKAS